MNRAWLRFYRAPLAKILTGFFVSAVCALPQAYTISAKPGVVNYIDGDVSLNGETVSAHNLKAVFLNANDTISTAAGKAEVLLAPGVFLRLGDHSEARMISPSLTDTQIELKSGDAMVEADNVIKDSRVSVIDHGTSVVIDRGGLYKFSAGENPTAAVLEGKANAYFGDRKVEIGKGRELSLAEAGKARKFDTKKSDDLYAWSNVRAEYNAASSYQAARDINAQGYGGVWGGYGFSGFSDPGWLWNSSFNSWAWLPGSGMFYSPFGFGFYSPGLVGYAPVVYTPLYGGGGGYAGGRYKQPVGGGASKAPVTTQGVVSRAVPVNPVKPAAVGAITSSPSANSLARAQAVHSYANSGGFRTSSGTVVPAGRGAAPAYGGGGGGAGRASAVSVSSPGGYSGVSSAGARGTSGMSSGGAPGGHGGSSGGGGGHH